MKNQKARIKKFLLAGILFLGLTLAGVFPVFGESGAILNLFPSTGVFAVGDVFSVQIRVDTSGKTINAGEGTLYFNPSELEVLEISKQGSIFNLWTLEPEFSNITGTIGFGGGSNRDFSGSAGLILTVKFKALKNAQSRVGFSSAAVLAADGLGTNILTQMNDAVFTLKPKTILPQAEYIAPEGAPKEPVITSPTHPDCSLWYNNPNPKFRWEIEKGIIAARMLVDKNPYSIPTISYSEPKTEKELLDLEDGSWYFHLQLKNTYGWSRVGRFCFQIDTQKPAFFNLSLLEKEITDPRAKIFLDAFDETSGIDYFEIRIDQSEPIRWRDDGSHIFTTPPLTPGKHFLFVKAVDRAGNLLTADLEFFIEALNRPQVTEYSSELKSGDFLIIKGKSYPSGRVNIWIQKDKEEEKKYETAVNREGNFVFVADERLNEGIYKIWLQAVNDKGAQSDFSDKITVVVRSPFFIRVGNQVINYLTVAIILVACFLLLVILVWYLISRFILLRKKLKKEVREAEESLHGAFDSLRRSFVKILEIWQKNKELGKISQEETEMIKRLKKDFSDWERRVGKEIDDIEKIVK